jgi:opacity protein-like surface antigen
MPFLSSIITKRLPQAALAGCFVVHSFGLLTAGEIELKSLNTVQNDPAAKTKYGPYAGFFGGANSSFSGMVNVSGINYDFNGRDNSAVFGFEVGKTWRSKKLPLSLSMEFEGSFMQTDFSGTLSPEEEARVMTLMEQRSRAKQPDRTLAPTPLPSSLEDEQATLTDGSLASYEVDMNAALFMVNGSISLDLWRYRARIGKVLGGLKPYVGGGFGGGQVWFRNNATLSRSQVQAWRTGDDVLAASGATTTPFAIDEFVTAWQWFGGVEYCWEDKYSVFAEFRHFFLGDMEDLTAFETKGYTVGFRYRY